MPRPKPDPTCPFCTGREVRRVRNYGRPVENEWVCCSGECSRRWDEDERSQPEPKTTDHAVRGRII